MVRPKIRSQVLLVLVVPVAVVYIVKTTTVLSSLSPDTLANPVEVASRRLSSKKGKHATAATRNKCEINLPSDNQTTGRVVYFEDDSVDWDCRMNYSGILLVGTGFDGLVLAAPFPCGAGKSTRYWAFKVPISRNITHGSMLSELPDSVLSQHRLLHSRLYNNGSSRAWSHMERPDTTVGHLANAVGTISIPFDAIWCLREAIWKTAHIPLDISGSARGDVAACVFHLLEGERLVGLATQQAVIRIPLPDDSSNNNKEQYRQAEPILQSVFSLAQRRTIATGFVSIYKTMFRALFVNCDVWLRHFLLLEDGSVTMVDFDRVRLLAVDDPDKEAVQQRQLWQLLNLIAVACHPTTETHEALPVKVNVCYDDPADEDTNTKEHLDLWNAVLRKCDLFPKRELQFHSWELDNATHILDKLTKWSEQDSEAAVFH